MTPVSKQWMAYFSSDPLTGAYNVSADGSTFSVNIPGAIRIPKDAISVEIGVLSSNIWNDANNISAAFGNNTFVYTTVGPGAGNYTLTIPDGLYSLEALNNYLSIQFTNNGQANNLMVFTGDSATSRCVVTFLLAGDSINFGLSTISSVVGFAGMGIITAPIAEYSVYGNQTAAFNRVNSYLITSDVVQSGIPVNSTSSQVIAQVPITVTPGSQINYAPSIIAFADGMHLIGDVRSNFTFQLRDQSLRLASTREIWGLILVINYITPINVLGKADRIR